MTTEKRRIVYVGGPIHGTQELREVTGEPIYLSQFTRFPLETRDAPDWLPEPHVYTKLISGEDFDVYQHQSLITPGSEAEALDTLIGELAKRRDKLSFKYGI